MSNLAQPSPSRPSLEFSPIRLVVQEPCLAKYRVPVYRELAAREGIDLKVVYGELPDLPNAPPDGFLGELTPLTIRRIGRHPVYWHQAQLDYATRRTTDVLILQWDVHYASLIPALLRARSHGVPTILWGHGFSKRERAWRSAVRNRVARLATALLFYNHTAARAVVERGWSPEKVHVAINSLDQAPIDAARQGWLADPGRLADFQRTHALETGPVVLYVSRLDPDNRLDLAIEAVHGLTSEFPSLQLIVVGKGEAERTRLEELARSLNVSERVRFVGAVYDEHELAPWFLSANVFCYPANIGLSLLHAFGYGLPVITSDRVESQNPEIEALRDGENGLLYADGSAASLSEALARLFRDEALAHRLSAAANETVSQRFSVEKMVDGIVAAVDYCVEQSHLAKS